MLEGTPITDEKCVRKFHTHFRLKTMWKGKSGCQEMSRVPLTPLKIGKTGCGVYGNSTLSLQFFKSKPFVVFCFFFLVLGFELRTYTLSHFTTGRVSQTICLVWL
jgi:hypothetical protein